MQVKEMSELIRTELRAFTSLEPWKWLLSEHVGSDLWWECLSRIGGPFESDISEISRINQGVKRVDFFWRDPNGVSGSNISQVLLDVNSVTNHKSWKPVSLNHVKNTDIWHQSIEVDSKWRGSYSFIPLTKDQSSEVALANSDGSPEAQREWYVSIMGQAISDPLNARPIIVSGRGTPASPLIMKEAGYEVGWAEWYRRELPEFKRDGISCFDWNSDLLQNTRRVWYFETGLDSNHPASTSKQKPIVILLDGQRWTTSSGAPSVLTHLTNTDLLAPAHYLLIDSINGNTRWQELSCNDLFWQAVFSELRDDANRRFTLPDFEHNVLVAGQSLGGLSALYAGLHCSDYVNKVISLSGSYWWPDVDRMMLNKSSDSPLKNKDKNKDKNNPTYLIEGTPLGGPLEDLQLNKVSVDHLELFVSVGSGEGDMNFYNDILATILKDKNAQFEFERFTGGHDWLAWRSSLVNGLRALIPSVSSPQPLSNYSS